MIYNVQQNKPNWVKLPEKYELGIAIASLLCTENDIWKNKIFIATGVNF